MISFGIIASQARSGGGGTRPDGSTAYLNLQTGYCYAGGADRTIADLLGGGFDPSSISGSGMYVAYAPASSNRPNAIGPLFDDLVAGLAAGCTIVFDINFINDAYGRYIDFLDGTNEGDSTDYVLGSMTGGLKRPDIEDQATLFLDSGSGMALAVGAHKIGLTFARQTAGVYEYAVSVDGLTAVSDTVAYPPLSSTATITLFHDGEDNNFVLDNAYVRSITLYPAKDPTDLPALTA
jgi:hypothetical protein